MGSNYKFVYCPQINFIIIANLSSRYKFKITNLYTFYSPQPRPVNRRYVATTGNRPLNMSFMLDNYFSFGRHESREGRLTSVEGFQHILPVKQICSYSNIQGPAEKPDDF